MRMIETPDHLIETPPINQQATDLLSDVLAHIRLSGAIYLKGEYSAPWHLETPESCELVDLLAPGTDRLILFHTIRKGRAWVSAAGYRVELEEGELAVLPQARRHMMGSMAPTDPVPIASLLPTPPWSEVPTCRWRGGGEETEMVCGYFRADAVLLDSFLGQLPPVFKVRPDAAAAELLRACIDYALQGHPLKSPGASAVLAKLPELLLAEALRLYSEQMDDTTGWLAAARDPLVRRALRLIHDAPSRQWTVDELARGAATSRSVLGERFRALLGQSPMRYLSQWRMQLAADLLRTSDLNLSAMADRLGYGSEPAFSRAFRRTYAVSPAEWRTKAG